MLPALQQALWCFFLETAFVQQDRQAQWQSRAGQMTARYALASEQEVMRLDFFG